MQRRSSTAVDDLDSPQSRVERLTIEAARPFIDASRVAKRPRVVAMPMRLAARALHVIAEQQYSSSAEYAGQIDRLMAAIHTVQNRVGVGVYAVARRAANPIESKLISRLLRARPALASEALTNSIEILAPPSPVARIEAISERRASPARIDNDYFGSPFNIGAVRFRERRAGSDADDSRAGPSACGTAISSPAVFGASGCAAFCGTCSIISTRASPLRTS